MLSKLLYKSLLLLDPEKSHTIAKWGMKNRLLSPGPFISKYQCILFGTQIHNKLGLAAGFDKNAELIDVIQDYGFGFIEIGSITYHGSRGNPKPRLFRLDDKNLLNRMGLNGLPAAQVVENIKKANNKHFGINITKTHSPDILGDKAIEDVASTYKLINEYGLYNVLNISCPNTKEGKTFEDPSALSELLKEITLHRKKVPLLVKLSPSLVMNSRPEQILGNIIQICSYYNVDGFVCSNTIPFTHPVHGKGGKSGSDLYEYVLKMIQFARTFTDKTIIACGGIMTSHEAMLLQYAGANFFQAYTGFVRGPNAGVNFAHIVNKGIE